MLNFLFEMPYFSIFKVALRQIITYAQNG